jgi:hypothetical protein
MYAALNFLTASFTSPEQIGTNIPSILWLLPLSLAIATVYKATKVTKIKSFDFTKEVLILFFTIVLVFALAGVILLFLTWLITE